MHTFTSSRLTTGNTVFPITIQIGNGYLYCRKGFIIGLDSGSIALRNIASVRIIRRIIFSDIVIETVGGRRLYLNGFYPSDAANIARLLRT